MKPIIERALEIEDELIEIRRELHKNPEVGIELSKTIKIIKNKLDEYGIENFECGSKGITDEVIKKAEVVGIKINYNNSYGLGAIVGKEGKTILLRADMDALPMEETTNLEFKSQNKNGHMCGHDMHTAILLGAAKILKEREETLKGRVKFMFQTGEELGFGSKLMVDSGILENPKVEGAIALHVNPEIDLGKIEYPKDVISSSMDSFFVHIKGKGGHSSMPHKTIDPLMITNIIYSIVNSMLAREIDPRETVAITVGKMGGGNASNIIPDTAELQIGIRCFNKDTRNYIAQRMDEIIKYVCLALRGSYDYLNFYTPSAYNSKDMINNLIPTVENIVGKENVKETGAMAGTEDFSHLTEKVPGLFMFLGAGKEGNYPLHNPNMVLDEKAIHIGATILAECAIKWLEENN